MFCHLNADFNHDDFILKRLLSPKCGFLKYLKMQRFLVSKNESLNVRPTFLFSGAIFKNGLNPNMFFCKKCHLFMGQRR